LPVAVAPDARTDPFDEPETDMSLKRFAAPLAVTAAAWLAAPATGAAQQSLASGGQTHTVQRGDTLWDLARRYLGDPFLWPQIYKQNTAVVEDPHWIYPGEVLTIAGGTAPAVPGTQTPVAAADSTTPGDLADLGDGTDSLSADEAGAGAFPRIGARSATPETWRIDPRTYRALRPSEFYSSGFLTEQKSLAAGRVLGTSVPSQIQAASIDNRGAALLYATVGLQAPEGTRFEVGDSVMSFYLGKEIEGWGDVVHPTGLIRVTSTDGGRIIGTVVAVYGPVRGGQLILPAEKFGAVGDKRAVPVADGLSASVVGWPGYMELKDPLDVLFLDKGRQDGVRPGDVFELRRTPATPAESADVMATLTVVRVGERHSTVRVAKVASPKIAVGERARQVARLPS
jgi:LysM repeat protein